MSQLIAFLKFGAQVYEVQLSTNICRPYSTIFRPSCARTEIFVHQDQELNRALRMSPLTPDGMQEIEFLSTQLQLGLFSARRLLTGPRSARRR